MPQQVVDQYRKEYCDVVNKFGYGSDVFAALRHSAGFIKATADEWMEKAAVWTFLNLFN